MWPIELGLRTFSILEHYRFLSRMIFTGSVPTPHKSFETMFKIAHFGIIKAIIDAC